MKSQKDCVFEAICSVKGVEGGFDGVVVLSKDEKAKVVEIVSEMLWSGEGNLSDEARVKYASCEGLRKEYTPGMVKNWLMKDTRLNGGTPHKIKNPGSRGVQDETLKTLNTLRKIATTDEARAAIDAEIVAYKATLAPKGPTQEEILAKLPPDKQARLAEILKKAS